MRSPVVWYALGGSTRLFDSRDPVYVRRGHIARTAVVNIGSIRSTGLVLRYDVDFGAQQYQWVFLPTRTVSQTDEERQSIHATRLVSQSVRRGFDTAQRRPSADRQLLRNAVGVRIHVLHLWLDQVPNNGSQFITRNRSRRCPFQGEGKLIPTPSELKQRNDDSLPYPLAPALRGEGKGQGIS